VNGDAYAAYRVLYAARAGDRTTELFVRRYVATELSADRSGLVLEVGSGTGESVRALRTLGWTNVRGSDLSQAQVDESARRGVEIELGGAVEVLRRQSPDSVSGIIALDVLEHLPDDELESFSRLCASRLGADGRLVVRVPNGAGAFGGAVRYGDLTHRRAFTEQSLRQLFAMVGLRPVAFRPCRPLVHGVMSAGRWLAWLGCEAMLRFAHAAETGTHRALVTRNIVAVARRN